MKFTELIEKIKKSNNNEWLEEIETRNYLPFNVKYGLASMMARSVLVENNGVLRYDNLKLEMYGDFLLLQYTNIEKDKEYTVEDYDILKEKGVFETILKELKEDEEYGRTDYDRLFYQLRNNADAIIDEYRVKNSGVTGIIRNATENILNQIVSQYNTTAGKKSIKGIIKDINNNKELLDTINNVMGHLNLDIVKDELLKRLAIAENIKKEEKKNKINDKKE